MRLRFGRGEEGGAPAPFGLRDLGDAPRPVCVDIRDRVRDLMVLVVPRLLRDELESLVEPDVYLEDDGGARAFAKAFIYDEMPEVDVADDLSSVMLLTVPSLELSVDDRIGCDEDEYDFALEKAWFGPGFVVPSFVAALPAPASVSMLPAPEPVLSVEAPSEAPCSMKDEEVRIVEDVFSAPMVTFAFGSARSNGGWTVSFSF